MTVHFQGAYIDKSEVRIDPDDRGFLLADGLYEVIRTYNGRLFRAQEHLRRLDHGVEALRLDRERIPDLISIAETLLDCNHLRVGGDAMIYMQITRGVAPRSHSFPTPKTPLTVYAYARPLVSRNEVQERGISAITVPDQRWSRCDIKSIALLPNTLANQKACDAGAEEAIFVRNGAVQEGTHSNVMIVQNGIVKTPPLTNFVLAGITRQAVLDLCRLKGVEYRESPIFLDDLECAEEVLVTGTTWEITPVTQIDGRQVGEGHPGPVTRSLQIAFGEMKQNYR